MSGTSIGEPYVVDNGNVRTPKETASHVVGDDCDVFVTDSGEIRVAYQDSTAGKLRYAVGTTKSGGTIDWVVREIDQPGTAGFFPKHVRVDGNPRVVNWWRTGGNSIESNVRVVSP